MFQYASFGKFKKESANLKKFGGNVWSPSRNGSYCVSV